MKRWFSSGARPLSFVERAQLYGLNSLLGLFLHKDGFDSKLKGLKVTKLDSDAGRVVCEMQVTKETSNAFGHLHGGCQCLLIDVVGTMALLTKDVKRPGVSVEISSSFNRAAAAGETIEIEGVVTKYGARLGFTRVDIRNQHGLIVASGRHTKAFT